MYNSLVSYFDKYNILYQNQFSFRQGHSSHYALITLVNKITQSLDLGDMVIGIFLDLKKSFNTVNHKILVKKLYSYGIRGQSINWFKSYLENRSQYVTYNEKRSDIKNIICGVPQGSILGPLLFLIYINNFASVSSKLYYVLFADDTNVFIFGNNLRKLINTLHIDLDQLYAWLQSNKLTLHLLKTHYMMFHRAKQKHMDVKLCINKVPIQQVDNTKFLGVIIDDNLNWSNHISYINSKIAKGIGIICRARKFFSKSALYYLYYAFIFPYLIYCVEVWDNALSTHTQPLIKLQNKIIRIITNSHFLASSEKLYN